MENKFKKLCILLFTCATIFGLSYNNGVTAKAVTTGQSLVSTTSSAVTTGAATGAVPITQKYTVHELYLTNDSFAKKNCPYYPNRTTGFLIANEDHDFHYFENGKLITNSFIEVFLVKENIKYTTYVDEEGRKVDYGWRNINGDWYLFDVILCQLRTGWVELYNSDYRTNNQPSYTWYYCDNTGKRISNAIVDGYMLDKEGKYTGDWMNISYTKERTFAKEIKYL